MDSSGRPATVTVLESSGHVGYDMDLVNVIATWRYSPFTVDGKRVPACGVVKASYRQN